MKIAIGIDHNGSNIKAKIITHLEKEGNIVIDNCPANNPLDDYPDFAFNVGKLVANKEADLGILMCGTGIGMSIAANKVKNIRCAHVSNENEASLAKKHNNANVLAISTKNETSEILKIIDIFINTNFSEEERHIRRNNKIAKYEEQQCIKH
ncbi:MAG: RpiB/LacA/LacB family sugar-phosphate isomerase [Bacilli bacterium]|nr:RpiB/LacA/LacB family sugar-phosphate isomerase [Bacilli bacterium]MDD4795114.1 RpiB/LacA/LacB family sugar-phosphate isomerase [Bacilli bacterium]